jgi:molecular chaperone HtpG
MDDPYRGSARHRLPDAPGDTGIVGEVIAQFADPYAFYRELVQNAIDAGTPAVEVELVYDAPAGRLRVAVRDRGEGMTRDILENQLLVLFRSTKERDRTKIGKFGIGFASVLGANPEVVSIQTARDGRRLVVHLYRDLSYELFDAGPATQTGTAIELELAMEPAQVARFAEASRQALARWCRHASVPIQVTYEGQTTRIDRSLGLDDALVEVRRTTDDGQLTVVVGIPADRLPYVGFYNHGLTLYETQDPLVGQVAVKIQDARLGHTISRDDVRRDHHFERALAFARELVNHDLRVAVSEALHAAADRGDLARHGALLAAVSAMRFALPLAQIRLPLVHEWNGSCSISAVPLGSFAWFSARRSPLTEALAARGVPVIHGTDFHTVATAIGLVSSCRLVDVEVELTSITPVERTPADEVLVATLTELFDHVHRPPSAIVLARLHGVRSDRLAIAGQARFASHVHAVDRDEAARNPFAFLQRRPLILSIEHDHVRAARAHDDPVLAASLLARAVLLQHRLLTPERSHRMLERLLARDEVAR